MEHDTEQYCRKLALQHGGMLIKLSPIAGLAGIPDRLLLWWGKVIFIEFKADGKYLKPRQKWWRDWLAAHRFRVYLFRTTAEFQTLLDTLSNYSQTAPESLNGVDNADVAAAPVPAPGDGAGSDPQGRRVRHLR